MDNVTFITNTQRHNVTIGSTRSSYVGRMLVRTAIEDNPIVSLDYETTGLDALSDKLLLTSIKAGDKIFVIDNTTVKLTDVLTTQDLVNKTVIAHHAKFEYKFSKMNGLNIDKMFCTMVAEQRLIMGTGLSASIVDTLTRRGVILPEGMNKEVRERFIGADPDTIVWTDEEILYSLGDVDCLVPLKARQDLFIDKFAMQYLIYDIEMPLINVLGDMELEGFRHNSEQWVNYAKSKQVEAQQVIQELDTYLIDKGINAELINPDLIKKNESKAKKLERLEVRKSKLEEKVNDFELKEKTHLKAYTITKESFQKVCDEYYTLSLEEDETELQVGINWSSSDQVIKVFQALDNFPLPMDKNKTTKKWQPSVGKEARSTWFGANQESEYLEFFSKYDKYKKLIHNINSFGEEWVRKYTHPVTNKVHTYFWQCNTETGRLASGDARNGLFNGQQIPAIEELRSCFIADEGCDLITIDLSSAELVVMASHSNDKYLYNLFVVYDDIHSSILTKAWRKIWKHRGDIDKAESFIVSKTENATYRKKGKNGTFAVVYGAYPAKLATTLDISVPEAKLYVTAVEEEIEPTIKFVESKTQEALEKGYVIHNTRTNSRRWFTPVLESMKNEIDLSFKDESNVSSAARNTTIQGTQADMVKEAMVKIDRFNKENNLNVAFKLQVHDELVIQKPIGLEVMCPYTNVLVKYEDYVHKELTSVANLYLREDFNMGADYHVANYWLK
jgi:DNA polymerase I-like protein with 3'-5' exonuclease and polymerase domains